MHFEIIPSVIMLISLPQAKDQLNIEHDFTDQDDFITECILAAQAAAESYVAAPVAMRQLVLFDGGFNEVVVKVGLQSSIGAVEYREAAEDEYETLDPSKYTFRNDVVANQKVLKFSSAVPLIIPGDDEAVKITINEGYTADNCPKDIIQAVKLLMTDFFERREDHNVSYNTAALHLLRNHRIYG